MIAVPMIYFYSPSDCSVLHLTVYNPDRLQCASLSELLNSDHPLYVSLPTRLILIVCVTSHYLSVLLRLINHVLHSM